MGDPSPSPGRPGRLGVRGIAGLDSHETVLNYARSARTSTGQRVDACLVETDYPIGVKTSDEAMRQLQLRPHENQPTRNYTPSPS